MGNHLGNVLATISDKKVPVDDGTYAHNSSTGLLEKVNNTLDGVLDYYNADVVTANDYYPSGMIMPGRKYQAGSTSYRYGFNGKEKISEISNDYYDFNARVLDMRIGRWFAMDPKDKAHVSSYQYSANNPVNYIDPDGRDEIHFFYRTKVKYSSFRGVTFEIVEKYIVIVPKEGAHRFYKHSYIDDANAPSLSEPTVKELETVCGNDKSEIASNFQRFPGALEQMISANKGYAEISRSDTKLSDKVNNSYFLEEIKRYVKVNEKAREDAFILLNNGLTEVLGVERAIGAVFA